MSKPLTGSKVLLIVAPRNFEEKEVAILKPLLEGAGVSIVIASTEEGEATGSSGTTVSAVSITEPRTSEFAGAIVIGGPGSPAHLWTNGLVHKSLRMLERDRRPIGALEHSVVVLAKAGLLSKKRATCFVTAEALKELKEAGAHYEKRPVVIDGDVVTADGAASAGLFGSLFLDLLRQHEAERSRHTV